VLVLQVAVLEVGAIGIQSMAIWCRTTALVQVQVGVLWVVLGTMTLFRGEVVADMPLRVVTVVSHQRQKVNMDLVVLRTATSSLLSYSVVPEVGAEVSTQEPTMRVQEELGLVVQFG
jgi:hypothetical protein